MDAFRQAATTVLALSTYGGLMAEKIFYFQRYPFPKCRNM